MCTEPKSSVFIQWKGTNVCCDLHCKCGHNSHFDGFFAHVLRCPKCGQLWEMPADTYPIAIDKTDRTPLEANPDVR